MERLQAINTVFEDREYLIRCFEDIQDSGDLSTIGEAGAMVLLLDHLSGTFSLHQGQEEDPLRLHSKERVQQFDQDAQNIG